MTKKQKSVQRQIFLVEVDAKDDALLVIHRILNKDAPPYFRVRHVSPMQEKMLDVFGQIDNELNNLREDLNSHERNHDR